MKNKQYRCVTSMRDILEYIGDSTTIAFDFETAPDEKWRDDPTAALDPHKSHVVDCSLSVSPDTAIQVPLAHKVGTNLDPDEFFRWFSGILTSPSYTKVAHNLSFEASFCYALGIVIQEPVYDTMAAAQMTLKSNTEFRKLSDSGLKPLARDLLHEDVHSFEEVSDGRLFDELDAQDPEVTRYSCADSDYALKLMALFNDWFDRFLPRHRTIVEKIESPTAVYLGLMKYNGVPIDQELMQQRDAEASNQMQRLREEISFIIGDVDIGSNCSTKAFKDYLYGKLGLPVLKTTATNKEAADDVSMQLLKEWCDKNRPELSSLFSLVQEYRKWGKIRSTYIAGYQKFINPATGRLHPNFFALSTDTGRMNCQRPNCFDPETEVLTLRGFVKFPDLLKDDLVAQWDNGIVTFVKPTAYIDREYTGDLIRIRNQHVSLLVTPDHRCLLKSRRSGKLTVVPASEYKEDMVQLNAGNFEFGSIHLEDDEITLLAATQADGHYHNGGIEFQFAKARKYRRLLCALLRGNIPYSDIQKGNGQVVLRILAGDVASRIMERLGPEKAWGPWLLAYDRSTILRLLDEIWNWDGCFTRRNYYSSSYQVNTDWMQILFTLTGKRAHLREYHNSNPRSSTNYQLDVTDTDGSSTTRITKERVPYQGHVYCVSVPSSFIVVRRDGQTMVTGQCQNMPRKTNDPIGVRNFIKAPDGYLIVSCDFSQIELRVGAFYLSQAGDDTMREVYLKNLDLHAKTTSIIFNVPYEQAHDKSSEGYKEHRTIAKNVNFGVFYGLFPRGLQRTLKFKAGVEKTELECEDMIRNLKSGYPGLSIWQEEVKAEAHRRHYAETWLGRRRYLPGIDSDDWGKRSFAERCAMNTPIQGTAADILKLGCARILAGLPERPWLKPILQIHDELTFIVPKDHLSDAVTFIRASMEPQPFPEFNLPLIAEASAGPAFGEMEELDD